MARAPAMRRRTFRDHLLSRKVWQRLTDGGKAFTPPREEILPERQTRVPAETPPRSAAFSGRHGNARIVSLLLWQISAASLGPLPTTGSGPRRTRRLRLRLSEEHDPVAFQHLAGFLVPAKILPSDASGGRRVKPSSDGQGGRSMSRPDSVDANPMRFSKNCPSIDGRWPSGSETIPTLRRTCPEIFSVARSPLKRTLMKTNFIVNLN